jgi:hypothetical protein
MTQRALFLGTALLALWAADTLARTPVGDASIHGVAFLRSGVIEFGLKDASGAFLSCNPTLAATDPRAAAVFRISACASSTDATCLAYTQRLASMLLAAKLAGKNISLWHDNCAVDRIEVY